MKQTANDPVISLDELYRLAQQINFSPSDESWDGLIAHIESHAFPSLLPEDRRTVNGCLHGLALRLTDLKTRWQETCLPTTWTREVINASWLVQEVSALLAGVEIRRAQQRLAEQKSEGGASAPVGQSANAFTYQAPRGEIRFREFL